MPKFEFVSLSPPPRDDGKVYDSMTVNGKDEYRLRYADFRMVHQIEAKTDCILTVCQKDWTLQKQFEVGICGTPENIKKAKIIIPERLVSSRIPTFQYTD